MYKRINSKAGAYYKRWASSYGPYMAKLIDAVLLAPRHEEQGYNSGNGILYICTNRPRLLVEEAAKLCVESGACRYCYFKKTLLKLADSQHSDTVEQVLPEHENLRERRYISDE